MAKYKSLTSFQRIDCFSFKHFNIFDIYLFNQGFSVNFFYYCKSPYMEKKIIFITIITNKYKRKRF